jgi:O-antigen ligase
MRIVIWSQCIEAIKESPFFGYGPEGYQFHPDNSYGIQPHNVIFQFLMSYGFIGTSIILSLYLIVMSSGINKIINKKNKSYDIINIDNLRVSLLIIVGFSIFGLVDGTFYHAQSLYIICIAFSVLISNYINTNSENCIYNPR